MILFLQPKRYFERLGVDFNKVKIPYICGLPVVGLNLTSEIMKYRLIISCIDHSEVNVLVVGHAKLLGVKTLFIMDGIYDFANAHYNPYLVKKGHKLLGRTEYSVIFHIEKELTCFYQEVSDESYTYLPKHADVSERDAGKSMNNFFLITTANKPYFQEKEYIRLIAFLKEIVLSLMDKGVDYKFRIFDSRIVNELKIEASSNLIDCSIEKAVVDARGVFTTPSTVVYTAIAMNKAVCILNLRNMPVIQAAGWYINSREDISDTLDSMVDGDKSRMEYQKKFLPDRHFNITEKINDLADQKYYLKKFLVTPRVVYFNLDPLIYYVTKFKRVKLISRLTEIIRD